MQYSSVVLRHMKVQEIRGETGILNKQKTLGSSRIWVLELKIFLDAIR